MYNFTRRLRRRFIWRKYFNFWWGDQIYRLNTVVEYFWRYDWHLNRYFTPRSYKYTSSECRWGISVLVIIFLSVCVYGCVSIANFVKYFKETRYWHCWGNVRLRTLVLLCTASTWGDCSFFLSLHFYFLLFVFVCLSVHLSVCLSVCLSIYQSMCVCLCVSVLVCLSVCLCGCLYVCLYVLCIYVCCLYCHQCL